MKNKRVSRISPHSHTLRVAPMLVLALCSPLCHAGEGEPAAAEPVEPSEVSRTLPEGTPSLQMSTDYAHPALGFGTYVPQGQVESRGIRVAPFTVRAAVQAGVGYNDNVALAQTNKVSSMFYTVAPSVSVGLEGATQRYYVIYRGNYGVYSSGAQDDYANHNIGVVAANSWTTRLRTLASYDFTTGHTPRGVTTSSSRTSEEWVEQALRGTVSYGAAGAQGGLQGEFGYLTRRYDNSAAAATAEYNRLDLGGTFSYRVGPKTRALINVARSDIEHPRDQTLDNSEMRYQVGVVWEAMAKTTGALRVGYVTKEFSSAAREDFTSSSFETTVTWTPRTYSVLELSARRFLSEAFEAGGSFVVNTVGGAVWSHQWPGGVRSTLNYVYGQVQQEGLNRTDTYQNIGGRVSYPLRRSLRLGAEIRHDSRDSDAAGQNYTRNIMLLTLETAL